MPSATRSVTSVGSQGTNELIHRGANSARNADDILEHYRELYSDVLSFKHLENSKKRSDFNDARAKFYGLDYVISESSQKTDKTQVKAKKYSDHVGSKADRKDEKPERRTEGAPDAAIINSLDPKSRAVYDVICASEGARLDDLVAAGVAAGAAMAALTVLEIRGLISQKPGGLYVKK